MVPALQARGPAAAATTSLRDTTRIAASGPAVWRDILLENRAHVLPLVRALERRVSDLGNAIEKKDAHTLEKLLATGRTAREQLMQVAPPVKKA